MTAKLYKLEHWNFVGKCILLISNILTNTVELLQKSPKLLEKMSPKYILIIPFYGRCLTATRSGQVHSLRDGRRCGSSQITLGCFVITVLEKNIDVNTYL